MTEREQFEAWCKSKGAPKENWWVRQLDDGGYSCHAVDMAWEAWQAARTQPAHDVPLCKNCGRWMNDPAVNHGPHGCCPAPPAQEVPRLTQEKIEEIAEPYNSRYGFAWPGFARAIESALLKKMQGGKA